MTAIDISPGQAGYALNGPNILPKAEWHILLEQSVEVAQKKHQPLSVMFIDIDNLKHINDTYGHAEGDHAIDELQRAIILIQNSFRTQNKEYGKRPVDIAAIDTIRQAKTVIANIDGKEIKIDPGRIGGDEFAVLCHTDTKGVEIIVDRLREIFRSALGKKLKSIGVDLSVGTSTLKPKMAVSELLKLADKRLYKDKQSHLPKLSDEEIIVFRDLIKTLQRMNIRPRDMGKYAALYAKDYIRKNS